MLHFSDIVVVGASDSITRRRDVAGCEQQAEGLCLHEESQEKL